MPRDRLCREDYSCAVAIPLGPNVTHKSWANGEIHLPMTHPEKLWTTAATLNEKCLLLLNKCTRRGEHPGEVTCSFSTSYWGNVHFCKQNVHFMTQGEGLGEEEISEMRNKTGLQVDDLPDESCWAVITNCYCMPFDSPILPYSNSIASLFSSLPVSNWKLSLYSTLLLVFFHGLFWI